MIVRVIRPNITRIDEEGINLHNSYERTIQCDDYELEDEGDRSLLRLLPNKGYFSLVKKPGVEIYVMNDDGKTIQAYRWNEKGERR